MSKFDINTVKMDARYKGREVEKSRDCTHGWVYDAGRVRLKGRRRSMTVPFRMGTGLGGRTPTPGEVLASLRYDAQAGQGSFDDFCSELGYDPDSREAERVHRACIAIRGKMERVFGEDFDALMDLDPEELEREAFEAAEVAK